MQKMIRDPLKEMLSKEEMERLQEKILISQVEYVYKNSIFHREKWDEADIKVEDIKSVADIRKLPLVTIADLQQKVSTEDPYGGRLCLHSTDFTISFSPELFVPEEKDIYICLTSRDATNMVESLARQWMAVGVRPGDKVSIADTLPPSLLEVLSTVWSLPHIEYGISETMGCLTCNNLGLPPMAGRGLHICQQFNPNTLFVSQMMVSSYMDAAEKLGVSVEDLNLKNIVIVYRGIIGKDERKKYEDFWGAKVFSMLCIKENLFYATDCEEMNGIHVYEDKYFVETVDAGTGEPVKEEIGKLAITNLFAEATPIIRYLSNIDVELDEDSCPCGRTNLRIISNNY